MNIFDKFLYFLNNLEMKAPKSWGLFHLMWIIIVIISIILMIIYRKKYNEKNLNKVLLTYGIISFILELTKQIMWSFNYENGVVTYSYQWYAAPFQLCTTPMYVSLIIPFIKNKNVKEHLLSYLAFITIISSFMVILVPDSCFTKDILINIHTMFLHCIAFVVSMYILINKAVEVKFENIFKAYKVFLIFALIALSLDILVYKSGILHGQNFNMFYISPYFNSVIPVFDTLSDKLPYLAFLSIYLLSIFLASIIVYFIIKFILKIIKLKK